MQCAYFDEPLFLNKVALSFSLSSFSIFQYISYDKPSKYDKPCNLIFITNCEKHPSLVQAFARYSFWILFVYLLQKLLEFTKTHLLFVAKFSRCSLQDSSLTAFKFVSSLVLQFICYNKSKVCWKIHFSKNLRHKEMNKLIFVLYC